MTLFSSTKFFPVVVVAFILFISASFSVVASEVDQAKLSLERLTQSLRNLNFNTSFVVVKNNQAEPYHWLHCNLEKNIK